MNANFEFYGKKLRGQQEIQPRWKRCVDATEAALGEVIGKLYVEDKFAGSSKDVALEMIGDIFGAFESGLPSLEWMDDTTRGRAMEKVGTLNQKIGYPDEWRDYSDLAVAEGELLRQRPRLDGVRVRLRHRQDRQAGRTATSGA